MYIIFFNCYMIESENLQRVKTIERKNSIKIYHLSITNIRNSHFEIDN